VVVRVGSEMSSLPRELQAKVIDYAANYRTPRGDLLFGRHCAMIMSGAAGAWAVAILFNRTVAMSNNYILLWAEFLVGIGRYRNSCEVEWSGDF